MKTVLPREQAVEDIFSRILASPEASGRLRKVFYQYLDDEHMLVDEDPDHFLQVLFHAYQNGDVSALLLELCGKSMFDLLREAYLIPRKFHGKAGENPVLLTNVEGELLPEAGKMVSAHEYEKFKETFDRHECVPRSGLYLADGYDIVHSYTDGLEIKEEKEERQRGILILYALPDTCKLGLTEAQTYAVVWKTFQEIQQAAPHAVVFYGQETGIKKKVPINPLMSLAFSFLSMSLRRKCFSAWRKLMESFLPAGNG